MRMYIDCGVKFGRTAKHEALVPYNAGELKREMERCQIHAALVENAASSESSYVRGNAEAIETCRLFKIDFDGIDQSDGHIGEAVDEATGLIDEAATVGNILTIHGYGLKIEADDAHKDQVGVFFKTDGGHA